MPHRIWTMLDQQAEDEAYFLAENKLINHQPIDDSDVWLLDDHTSWYDDWQAKRMRTEDRVLT